MRSAWRAGMVIARSSSSAMRPTTAASASPPRRPRPCACPVLSNASACSASSWCRARSTGRAGLLRAAGRPISQPDHRCLGGLIVWQNIVDAGRAFARLLFRSRSGTDMTSLSGDTDDAQMASACPHRRAHRDDRLRLDRQRHPAADRAPFPLRQEALCRHRPRGQGPQAARPARHPLHPSGGHQGQLPPPADAAADSRRRPGLLRQRVGRHLVARHHGAVPRNRRALHRHRGRALEGLLFRYQARSGSALELCAARNDPRCAPQTAGRPDRGVAAAAPIPAWCPGSSSRRCSTSPATSG